MNKKSEKKQKEKSINVITNPFNFEHRFHVGVDGVNLKELQAFFEHNARPGDPSEPVATGADMNNTPRTGDQISAQLEQDVLNTLKAGGIGVHNEQTDSPVLHAPPTPCPSRDISGEHGFQSGSLVQQLKEELIPAIRFELDELLDKKLTALLTRLGSNSPSNGQSGQKHCSTCRCKIQEFQSSQQTDHCFGNEHDTNNGYIREQERRAGPSSSHCDENHVLGKGAKLNVPCGIHNPVYPVESEHDIIHHVTHQQGTLVIPKTEPTDSLTSNGKSTLLSSNGDPMKTYDKPQQVAVPALPPCSKDLDDRESLAKALQVNVEAIVDGVVFDQSELRQTLVTDGCITESERDYFLSFPDHKDQIRAILVLVKGRDLKVLQNFLKNLKTHNEAVYEAIQLSYTANQRAGVSSSKCVLCRLMSQVHVKYIVDGMWSCDIVNDSLYMLARGCEAPVGAQQVVWQKLVYSINQALSHEHRKHTVVSVLKGCLSKNNHYTHIAALLETDLRQFPQFECRCDIMRQALEKKDVSTSGPTAQTSRSKLRDEHGVFRPSKAGEETRLSDELQNSGQQTIPVEKHADTNKANREAAAVSTGTDVVQDSNGMSTPDQVPRQQRYRNDHLDAVDSASTETLPTIPKPAKRKVKTKVNAAELELDASYV